ncbi:hypothetical protein, conserved [Eimeria praecox]|uniref:Cytidyltransferase-like domain-containing protein n=1 Tax=Eimeria praecox TaxID=51316 RepID=U6G5S6_9EIME|nr:hypothetical protein, conserved [Eimeria praecox]
MIPAASCCFQEDAACVIIDGEVVRRLASAGANGATEPCAGEPGEVNDLVLFLGRALLLTRRSLYVLLCLPAGAHTIPPPPFTNESQYGGRGPRVGDAATSVSCGMQIWHLIVLLNTRVGSLARRIGLASAPIIVPWNCEASRKQVSGAGLPPACTRWVERARAAVLRHYRLTVGNSAFWHSADEEGLVNAVPLVLDDDSTFSSRAACDLWPRHCHLGPLGGSVQVCPSKQALLFEVEEQDISGIQRSMRRNQGNDSGVAAHGTSQGFDEAVGRRDTAKADGKVEAQEPFQYTLAAGTFDRLHPGHQLLLAAAALSTRQTIGLAVASGPLIKKKTASQEDAAAAGVEPFACRLQAAAAFVQLVAASKGKSVQLTGLREAIEEEETSLSDELQLQTSLLDESNQISCGFMPVVEGSTSTVVDAFGGSLQLQVFRITDAVGPADRLSFDCLVVSAETVKGANMVNTFRVEAGNEPVFVLTVDLVPTDASVVHQPSQALAAYLPSPFLKGVR